jgi:RNA polymerase sigma-70 factor (ECF subfamily)
MALEPNFQTTLTAARAGAEWAWAALYRESAPALLRYLKARRVTDPENTLGEIFFQVVRKLPDFAGGESEFRAWLFAICRNRIIDQARYEKRRPVGSSLDRLPETSYELPTAHQEASSPFAQQEVVDLLRHLTPEQQDVLFLRVLAGLTLEETAQVLNKTSGAVKRLQSRGLSSLRRKIARGVVSL